MAIGVLLLAIGGYLLVAIDGYFMVVNIDYFINGYWWLLYYKLLFIILCYITTIGDYSIIIYY